MKLSFALAILGAVVAPSEQRCIETGALAPISRPDLSAAGVCARDYSTPNLPDPYECFNSRYFCCATGSTPDGVGCNLIESDETGNAAIASQPLTGNECYATGALAPRSRSGLSPGDVCARDYSYENYLEPYECTSGARYACCAVGSSDTLTPGQGLGTCTTYVSGASMLTAKGVATVVGMAAVVAAGLL